jgi:hypothetical protein
MDILARKRVSDAGLGLGMAGRSRGVGVTDRFEKMHEGVFAKMDGIDKHYAANGRVLIKIRRR